MNCAACGSPIPSERLKALPGVDRCVKCVAEGGDVPRVRGKNVYDHKTGGSAQILSPGQFDAASRADPRSPAPGHGKGGYRGWRDEA